MFEQLREAYRRKGWVRLLAALGLLLSAILLFVLSGGFPPWAWSFLFSRIPLLPWLWQTQGSAILIPFIGLVLLSLSILVMWVILVVCAVKIALSAFATNSFSQDLEEAEQLAEQMVQQEWQSQARSQGAMQQEWQPEERVHQAWGGPPMQTPQPVQDWQAGLPSQFQERQVKSPIVAQEEDSRPYGAVRATKPLRAAAGAELVARIYPDYSGVRSNVSDQPTRPPVPEQPRREGLRLVPRPSALESRSFDNFNNVNQATRPFEREQLADEDTSDTDPIKILRARSQQAPLRTDPLREEVHTDELASELRLVVGIGLDPGLKRKNAPNEDNLFAIQAMRTGKYGPHPVGLFIVADGMGGHTNGQEASRLAIQVLSDAIVPALLRVDADEDTFDDLLRDGVHRANLALYQRNRAQNVLMGTTLTAALVVDATAYIANVGDSRTYIYSANDGLTQVTRDHSLVARLVEEGAITPDEIYTHPKRNQIYRCLGEQATVETDHFVRTLQQDDVLVLCSDGLWEMVRDPAIQQIVENASDHPSQISTQLVQAALKGGGADNISVVVVSVAPAENQ